MRVLIAVSHEDSLQVARVSLQHFGYEVELATDWRTCLQILGVYMPDILIMDDELQTKCCERILSEMQTDRMLANIPVVMLTSISQRDFDAEQYPNVVSSLHKPFRINDLIEKIDSLSRYQPTLLCSEQFS